MLMNTRLMKASVDQHLTPETNCKTSTLTVKTSTLTAKDININC